MRATHSEIRQLCGDASGDVNAITSIGAVKNKTTGLFHISFIFHILIVAVGAHLPNYGITFNSSEALVKAVGRLHGKPWKGKTLYACRHIDVSTWTNTVYLRNVSKELTEEKISNQLETILGERISGIARVFFDSGMLLHSLNVIYYCNCCSGFLLRLLFVCLARNNNNEH